jgi:phosphopantetheine--protein transferase-like protein
VTGHGVGIDIERVAERGSPLEEIALTDDERATLGKLGRDPAGRAAWFTRFWAAKEAVAKAEGTGLQGSPKRLAVEQIDGDRLLVTVDSPNHDSHGLPRWVETRLVDDATGGSPATYAVAWTAPEQDPPPLRTGAQRDEG